MLDTLKTKEINGATYSLLEDDQKGERWITIDDLFRDGDPVQVRRNDLILFLYGGDDES